MFLNGLVQASQGSPAVKEALWRLYEEGPDLRDKVLVQMLRSRDSHASEVFLQRLRSGDVTDSLSIGFGTLDAQQVRENRQLIGSLIVGAPSAALRFQAYSALAKADPEAALSLGLQGLWTLPENQQTSMLQKLWSSAKGDNARATIEGAVSGSEPLRKALERLKAGK